MYDSVTLPTIGDDGAMGFIGLTNGSTQSVLYYNQFATRFDDQPLLDVTGGGGFRPMISNTGAIVIRKGSGATAEIVVASSDGVLTVASSALQDSRVSA